MDISKVPLAECLKHFIKMWKKTDQRSVNFGKCDKKHNANVIKILAKICPNQKRNFADRISHDRKRGGRCIDQGSHNLSKSRRGSVSKNVSSSQKGWVSEINGGFQNGGFAPF